MAPQEAQRNGKPGGDDGSSPPGASRTPDERAIVLVDASNVAHSSEGERARLASVLLVADKVREEGFDPVIVADEVVLERRGKRRKE